MVKLFSKDAPKTVANFVGLATGEKDWKDPRDNQPRAAPPALRRDHLPPRHPRLHDPGR